jgi:hypothetical protein
MLSVTFLLCYWMSFLLTVNHYAEFLYPECEYVQYHLVSVITACLFMLSIIMECHHPEYPNAEYVYTEYHFAGCH